MEAILQQFAEIVEIVTPLAITFGLCQWVINWFISTILGRGTGRWLY